jgi:hypothetical protein
VIVCQCMSVSDPSNNTMHTTTMHMDYIAVDHAVTCDNMRATCAVTLHGMSDDQCQRANHHVIKHHVRSMCSDV